MKRTIVMLLAIWMISTMCMDSPRLKGTVIRLTNNLNEALQIFTGIGQSAGMRETMEPGVSKILKASFYNDESAPKGISISIGLPDRGKSKGFAKKRFTVDTLLQDGLLMRVEPGKKYISVLCSLGDDKWEPVVLKKKIKVKKK